MREWVKPNNVSKTRIPVKVYGKKKIVKKL